MAPLWELFQRYGSLRVTATMAERLGIVASPCLPQPLKALSGQERSPLKALLETTLRPLSCPPTARQ
ncbi:similar to dihydrodipicolinate synthetase [Zymobacter palmae]|uniref:Similar to dihydrodipicolinate synthetase n=1 Tax=Zymobacter palmae TaxID=33074 RepID=A0A348HIG1_9GAMM|nr:hypothetical protein [Zymobacter palmae]BBG31413.1 similar to dihydrodipicolinate synthetase [Zymobacter palmae]